MECQHHKQNSKEMPARKGGKISGTSDPGISASPTLRDSSPPVVDNQIEKITLLEGVDHEMLIHGPVTLKSGLRKKKHLAYLYGLVLLISDSRCKKSFDIKYRIPVNHLWIAECGNDTHRKGKPCLVNRSFLLGWPMSNFVATFPSSAIKEQWYSLLERQINLAKEENYVHSILTEINIEAMNRSACSIIVTVTNLDTANDVINLSLPVLGLTGSEQNYQLLVNSANEEAPQPLIGHENIYMIQTTYLRAAHPSPASENSTILPSFQESVLEELYSDVRGCFILKPRCQATGQCKSGGCITRLFRRNKSKSRDDLTKGHSSAAPLPVQFRKASLMALSRKEKLTSPLSDLLYLIIDKGPQAEEIFRKPGSVASYSALKQKISSRGTVDWSNESALVAATVLQDFLRSLPGTIFSAKLYDQWLDVLEKEDENKVPAIQRLLAQLPKANFIILKCLFGSLNKIVQQSTFKLMTTSDLSLCLAPSILSLWHATSRSSEVADELRKKISLTYFLIENCAEIFKDATNSVLRKSALIFCNNTGENAMNCNTVSEERDTIVDTEEMQSLDCQPMDMTPIKTSEELKGDAEPTFDMGPPSSVSEILLDKLVPLRTSTPISSIDTDYTDHLEEDLRSMTEELQTPLEPCSRMETDEEAQVGEGDKATHDTEEMQSLDCQPMDMTPIKTSEELKGDAEPTFDMGPPSSVSEILLDKLVPLRTSTPISSIDTDYTDHLEEDLRSMTEELQTPLEPCSRMETDEEAQVGEGDKATHDTEEMQSLDCQPMDMTPIKTSEELKGDAEPSFDMGPPSSVSEILLDKLVPLRTSTPISSIDTDYTDHLEEDLRSMTEELQTPLEPCSRMETDEEAQVGEGDKATHDPHLKPTQSEHSLRKWLNQWGSHRSRDRSLGEPTQLFGSLIQDVCKNDNLPAPLLDMLSIIDHKCLCTLGIFRKHGNQKSCRALQRKLNLGRQVNWKRQSALVVATTFMNFLQNIPGSLLTDHLYDNWLHVLDEGNEQTQIAAFQRLFKLLPTPNANILQSMFGSLFNISLNSTSFHETTSELSMYVAVSLLWPCISDISERKTEWQRKVALVKFLIENFMRIFRNDTFTSVEEITIDPKSNPATADGNMKSTQIIHSIRKWLNKWCLCGSKDLQPGEPIPSTSQSVHLFGSLIQDVCKDDNLPKSLLDMILLIEQQGPFTKDIFKKSGNEKSCRALKYKLNYGCQVNWESESAIDVAATLKDFLESIPSSLFTCYLYNEWLQVPDKGNEETQIAAIQRLLGELPKSNFKLLHSLIGVLEKIAKKSSLNNMTASKLSSCIAPSLFWLRGSTISERIKERRRKVAIVQFLIEHFSSIFGEDMTSPMLENAINQDNCSETSGTLNCLGDFDDKVTLIHPANDWVRLMHK
ncbi:uncharacterized protein [Oryctolagus cuniculus]|uniref:uncharacterized protein isoform X3 n=1 Tax=Oryctolagus cuniculus TaxID=9986 RepID=UPI0038798087